MGCGAARVRADTSAAANTRAAKKVVALSPWAQAEQGRDALEAMPEETRRRADYTRAMDAYRAIYHANPADVHAPAAVNAVAELLVEQGRGLGGAKGDAKGDAKILQAAVGQYEFLRTQYPGSSLGVQALLAEAEIEQNDLGDAAAAKEKYKLLLKTHPKSEQAEEAKAGLASLRQGAGVRDQRTVKAAVRKDVAPPPTHRDGAAMNGAHSVVTQTDVSEAIPFDRLRAGSGAPGSMGAAINGAPSAVQGTGLGSQQPAIGGTSVLPAMAQTSGANAKSVAATQPILHASAAKDGPPGSAGAASVMGTPAVVDVATDANRAKRSGKRALVTGIRHWSTATYTRVAIDLGDGVTYEAARVPNPDRIYFDLHGAKLAQELVGKSFAVTDDGFLKRVRAAQYSDDVTRVVLDVNYVTEYSAFLLPNPYRLIIDIHGGKGQTQGNNAQGAAAQETASVSVADAPAPRVAAVVKATPARPVPNAVATKSASAASDVADLSDLPGRVEATKKPTSKPISAVVEAENGDQGTENRGQGTGSADNANSAGAGEADPTHRDTTAMNGAPSSVAAAPAVSDSSKKTRKNRVRPAGGSGSAGAANTVAADAGPARAAVPTADGETSLVRALGLKIGRIVIDAGHGGHDSGTLGADGIQEKDVVLDVALRLGKLLHDRLGAEIIYTRSDDTFIPLETRTAIANKAQADLFLSIHANSSQDESARGVETYYLNFTSDPTALDVAARENAVSDQSIHQLSDLVKKIALKDKIAESREFAGDVEDSLYAGLEKGNAGLKDRGVKKAPFVVLIGANMPSILAEISFVTNPRDAEQLLEPEYRERVAESLYKGVAKYEGGLSGTRVPTERASVGQ